MNRFRLTPTAIVLAVVIIIFGAGSAAAAAQWINGHKIKPHTIDVSRLTPAAVAALKGQTGQTGPAGPPGPSNAYEAYRESSTYVTLTATDQTVLSLPNLPAGSYIVSGQVLAVGTTRVVCTATLGSQTATSITEGAGEGMLPFDFTSTVSSPSTASVACHIEGTSGPFVGHMHLIALKVGSASARTE